MSLIEVDHLTRDFMERAGTHGIMDALKSMVRREYTIANAIKDLSFSIEKGEIVGLVGPEGAGKTVILKILAGILAPTSGSVRVNGISPAQNRKQNAKQIGIVLNERSQLHWDLPVGDIFSLYQRLYDIPMDNYLKNKARLMALFHLEPVMGQMAHTLSAGDKIKVGIALAMLHAPDILYLDEPMNALDARSKRVIREGLRALNHEMSTTVLFTTHDMNDITTVCRRLILLEEGVKLFDGDYDVFTSQYEPDLTVKLEFQIMPRWKDDHRFTLMRVQDGALYVRVIPELTRREALVALITMYDPESITICEQHIGDIIAKIFERPNQEAFL